MEQVPWLDDNGDAVTDGNDGEATRGRGLVSFGGGSTPVVEWLEVGEVGASGAATNDSAGKGQRGGSEGDGGGLPGYVTCSNRANTIGDIICRGLPDFWVAWRCRSGY
jgi:hypothetical protein